MLHRLQECPRHGSHIGALNAGIGTGLVVPASGEHCGKLVLAGPVLDKVLFADTLFLILAAVLVLEAFEQRAGACEEFLRLKSQHSLSR